MVKRLIPNGELRGNLEFDVVEFMQNTNIDGSLKARRVICMGMLHVTGTLECDELEHPSGKAPIARRMIIGGVDSGDVGMEPMQLPPMELEDFDADDWSPGSVTVSREVETATPEQMAKASEATDPVLRVAAVLVGSDPVLEAA